MSKSWGVGRCGEEKKGRGGRGTGRAVAEGEQKERTRLTTKSKSLRSCTFKLCVDVFFLLRGVKSVPFKQTLLRRIESSTSAGTVVGGLPSAVAPDSESKRSHTTGALSASTTAMTAEVTSGPMPSPGMSVTV